MKHFWLFLFTISCVAFGVAVITERWGWAAGDVLIALFAMHQLTTSYFRDGYDEAVRDHGGWTDAELAELRDETAEPTK